MGASIGPYGVGWFEATAHWISEGPLKDIILIPVQPLTIRRSYEVRGLVDGSGAVIQVSAEGPTLKIDIASAMTEPKPFEIHLRGESGKQNAPIMLEPKGARNIDMQIQPLKPVVLVAHRKMFNPRLLMIALQNQGLTGGTLFGGTGIGKFSVELVLHTHAGSQTFSSGTINYS